MLLKIIVLNYPATKLISIKAAMVGNHGSYLIFQENGNFVHYDVSGSTNISNLNLPFKRQMLPFTGWKLPRYCLMR